MKVNDDETRQVIAQNLKRLRNGMSYGELARLVGTYPSSIKRIEDGQHMPGVGLLTRLAEALGVTANDLLDRANGSRKKTSQSA